MAAALDKHSAVVVEDVLLVDEVNTIVGRAPKLDAHINGGMLHRAFSVITIDGSRRMLLQRRADTKMTFPRLLSNTCCSHPLAEIPEEAEGIRGVKRAACRRYLFELNMDIDRPDETLTCVGIFRYKAVTPGAVRLQSLESASTEHKHTDLCESEIDYVLLHRATDAQIASIDCLIASQGYNKNEVSELAWMDGQDVERHWSQLTPWFQILYRQFVEPLLRQSPMCVNEVSETGPINFIAPPC